MDVHLSKLGQLVVLAGPNGGGKSRIHGSYELMPRRTVEVFQQCRDEAVARAVDAVGAPTLSRLFAAGP